ncbi:MAG: RNA-binding protein [Hyphomicrobiaceae bacterium]
MGLTAHTKAGRRQGDSPLRTCVVARTRHPADELIRFVLSPDGDIVPDLACRLPGRGVWVGCDRATIAKAAKSGAFNRSLKCHVKVPGDLAEIVERLLVRRTCDALALANKAGLVSAGATRVETEIRSGTPAALVHAIEGSPDGIVKLDRQFRAMCRDAGKAARIIRDLSSAELSLALGRSNVVHAALKSGGAAELFISEALRLRRYRAGVSEQSANMAAGHSAGPVKSNTGKV